LSPNPTPSDTSEDWNKFTGDFCNFSYPKSWNTTVGVSGVAFGPPNSIISSPTMNIKEGLTISHFSSLADGNGSILFKNEVEILVAAILIGNPGYKITKPTTPLGGNPPMITVEFSGENIDGSEEITYVYFISRPGVGVAMQFVAPLKRADS